MVGAVGCRMKDGLDSGAGEAMLIAGITAGTRIATAAGWRKVETLRPGDAVLTLEGGFQPVAALRSYRLPAQVAPPTVWPLIVPRGALDCREPILLLPDQQVLIESDQAELLFGDALALVPALALEGWRGIRRIQPRARAEALTLSFATPQLIYASRAVLLACPAMPGNRPCRAEKVAARPGLAGAALSREQARHLVACLMAEDLGGALQTFGPWPVC
jgi:hypothetical protein